MAPVISLRNAYNNILNSKFIKNNLIQDNPGEIAAKIALISTTTKDAVNCYYYVTQSLNNEKIPEEKRKFVAGLDLSNGILNVLVQLGMGSLVNTFSADLFEKWYGKKMTSEESVNAMYKKLVQKGKDYKLEDVAKAMGKAKKIAKGGFQVIAVLLATQVFVKRIVVPFLATPMAGVFKRQLEKREAGQQCPAVEPKQDENKTEVKDSEAKTVSPSANTFKSFDFNELASKPIKYQK